ARNAIQIAESECVTLISVLCDRGRNWHWVVGLVANRCAVSRPYSRRKTAAPTVRGRPADRGRDPTGSLQGSFARPRLDRKLNWLLFKTAVGRFCGRQRQSCERRWRSGCSLDGRDVTLRAIPKADRASPEGDFGPRLQRRTHGPLLVNAGSCQQRWSLKLV